MTLDPAIMRPMPDDFAPKITDEGDCTVGRVTLADGRECGMRFIRTFDAAMDSTLAQALRLSLWQATELGRLGCADSSLAAFVQ